MAVMSSSSEMLHFPWDSAADGSVVPQSQEEPECHTHTQTDRWTQREEIKQNSIRGDVWWLLEKHISH
jgi:hypothetical protein